MKYLLNITDSYQRLIDFDALSGITNYMSSPMLRDGNVEQCRLLLANTGINMDEEIWRQPILAANPQSIVASEDDAIFMILLRKATLTIEKIRSYDLKIINSGKTHYHSSGLAFHKKDRHIACGGESFEYPDTTVYGRINFSGQMFLEFCEEDIQIQIVGYSDDRIGGYEEVKKINREAELNVRSKNNVFHHDQFNSIKSPIWEFDFYKDHFCSQDEDGYSEAVKNYP